MSNKTHHITQSDLNNHLAQIILSDLTAIIDLRQPGHCLQVTDLPIGLMETICRELRMARPDCEVYILSLAPVQPWHITSTKLVERRNTGGAVIVVFLPPDLRTSAEDSFDVSTFERFPIGDLHQRLRKQLLTDLPADVRPIVEEIIRESGCIDEDAICRYLLAVQSTGASPPGIGLALHHLRLVPDPALLDDPSVLRPRLLRNAKAVETLSTPDNALFAKIQSLGLKQGRTPQALYHFFNQVGAFDPARWLPVILEESSAKELTFDQWDFREEITGDVDEITITDLGTTRRNEDDGYPLVDVQRDRNLKVAWETTPTPVNCSDLSYFTVEIMKDNVPVTEARTVKVGKSTGKRRSTTLKDLHKLDLEDGLYYLRVSAWATGGMLLRSAESESIFFKGGLEEDDEEEWDTSSRSQKQHTVTSLYEAMLRTQVNLRGQDKTLADLKRVEMSWVTPQRRIGRRYTDQFTIKYGAANQYVLPVNTILRRIEVETLSDADSLGRWELDLSRPPTAEIEPILQPFEGIDYDLLDEFLLIRRDLFQKILNQPAYPDIQFLAETSDLSQWEDEIVHYAGAYLELLNQLFARLSKASDEPGRQEILDANRQITSIDNVHLRLADGQNVYLMAPTHPLKMLWNLQYARVTRRWLDDLEALSGNQVSWSTFASFLPRLSSLNLPHTLVDAQGKLLINVDNFGPFWSIFVPLEARDARAQVGRIKSLLGSPEADDRFTTITGADLARKVQRYLAQHPYVTTIRLNAIQPGSGAILVEMLLELEHRRPDLRYLLHLFSDDFRREELGAALDELMAPSEKRSGREELDAFLTASQNALFPKMVYSKHRLADLLDTPDDFEAHVTMLFDAFKVQVEAAKPTPHARSNHLYGLLHEYVEQFTSGDGKIAWQRQIAPQPGLDLDEHGQVHETMVQLYQCYNYLAAAIASDGAHVDRVPTVCLPLGPTDKNLISLVHQVSDWVFTVDRNFGLEYLDNPYDEYCPVYLIDYQPEYLGEVGHRLIVSTQHVAEMEHIVRPVLDRLNLPAGASETRSLVNALRSVSGRLVLKLLSSPQVAHGVVGMALTRLFLEQSGLLQDMILIPLDSHSDLFTTARQEAELLQEVLSLRRTDMLLVELEPASATVTFHLIEVKFRQSLSLVAALDLKDEIADQLENSFQALRRLYDPHHTSPDRFDRLIRTRELVTLLGFYLERAVRYHLVDQAQAKPVQRLLDQLERGYTLRFTRSGVVLSLGQEGYQTEKDGDVAYHYLGLDRVAALITAACAAEDTGQTLSPDPVYSTTRGTFTRRPAGQPLRPPEPVSEPQVEPEPQPEKGITAKPIAEAAVLQEKTQESPEPPEKRKLACDVILGAKHHTPQYGILGRAAGRTVGLDLNGTNAISLFGVQGSGKSYTLGTILEMAVRPITGINQLPRPLAAVVFHYSKTEDYRPEFVSMAQANDGPEVEKLRKLYGADPAALPDVMVLTPEGKLEQRRAEFPHLAVHPIAFDTSELNIEDWKFLMGVIGSDAMYIKKMNQILRKYRNNLTLNAMYVGVADSRLTDAQRELAKTRLDFAKEYIRDGQFLGQYIRPGRLIVVDLRDELIEKGEALGLFMVMLKIFANAQHQGQTFNKLIVFDEAHKYMETVFINEVTGVVREMRHKGTTVLIASQDPPSVPLPIIELSSQIILHKFSSPSWLKHVQKGSTALRDLTAGRLNMLDKGEAYIWSREATHHEFESRAVKVDIRPRVTRHGGGTVTAL